MLLFKEMSAGIFPLGYFYLIFMIVYLITGIFGFWSGAMPRALGEALTVILGAAIAYGLNIYADKSLKSYASHISSFLAASLCYPFTVVSHCSIGEFYFYSLLIS